MSLGSGIRNKTVPDPGSRGQKGPNPESRIPDPDPQHWCVPMILSGGMHIFDWPTPSHPLPPPGSGSESGSTSRFWAGSGSCSGSASKQCGSILEIKRLFLYIMIRSKKLIWTSKTAFFHRHIENFLYSLITWLPFSDRKTGSVFCSPPMINCWLFAGEAPWSVAVIL